MGNSGVSRAVRMPFSLALLVLLAPAAAATTPEQLAAYAANTTVDPAALVVGAGWQAKAAQPCDELVSVAAVDTGERRMGVHDGGWIDTKCAQLAAAVPAALPAAPVPIETLGAGTAEPGSGAASLATSTVVGELKVSAAFATPSPADAGGAAAANPLTRAALPEGLPVPAIRPARPEPVALAPAESPAFERTPARPASSAGAAPGGATTVALPPGPGPSGAVAIASIAGLALAALAAALYQRFTRPDALKHPARQALHDALVALGAEATAGELARAVGIPRKTAEYHLVYLVRAGALREHGGEGEARRFALPAARAAPAPRDVLAELVRTTPGMTTRELAERAGLTRTRADRLAKALVLAGALEARSDEGERRFYAPGVVDGRSPT